MDVTAPYNFVPLADKVCTADDLGLHELPSQDSPEPGGLSGSISYTLHCNTPLLIGDGKDETRFLKGPGNSDPPIIPGSSLRGMLRNVIEIASFARFTTFVDNHRVGVRDLSPSAREDYGSRLSDIQAGWLTIKHCGGKTKIVLKKCDFRQILHTELDELSAGFSAKINMLAAKTDCDERGAEQVENLFGKNIKVRFSLGDDDAVLNKAGPHDGDLVFSGLPGTKTVDGTKVSSKLREFVFFGDKGANKLPDGVWQKFISVHEQQEKPSETWKWRRKTLNRGDPIPVFWLPDEQGNVAQIGLAMMFKIAADNTVHDLIPDAHNDAHEPDSIDLPSRIFGRVHDKDSFKTRVSFGFARLTSEYTETKHEVIAAKPKPSFTPSYIRQKDFGEVDGSRLLNWPYRDHHGNPKTAHAQYRSYMNWKNKKEELRGWKRYPAQGENPEVPRPGSGESASKLYPISNDNGLTFAGRIRFHNLHPIELGALLWALSWGGKTNLRHGLGMGKPFGWGQVWFDLAAVQYAYASPGNDPVKAFTDVMDGWAGDWENSLQIRQLLAMADPVLGSRRRQSHLKQMELDPKGRNHFQEAKDERSVLPEYLPDDETPGFAIADKYTVKGGPRRQGQNPPRNQNRQTAARPAQTRQAMLDGERVTVLSDDGTEASVEFASGDSEPVKSSELKYPS